MRGTVASRSDKAAAEPNNILRPFVSDGLVTGTVQTLTPGPSKASRIGLPRDGRLSATLVVCALLVVVAHGRGFWRPRNKASRAWSAALGGLGGGSCGRGASGAST